MAFSSRILIVYNAKDPSCVMCVTPYFGGAWHSSIRDGEGPQPVLPPVAGDSIAQRLGLLTKYNCDTSQLDFRFASTGINNWYVKTGLNFAGWSRPLTIIGRMYIASDDGGANSSDYDTNVFHPLLTQGWFASGSYAYTTLGLAYENYNGNNRYIARLSLVGGALLGLYATSVADPHGTIVTLALTIDPDTGNYVFCENGILIKSATDTRLVGFQINTDTSNPNNDPVSYIHQRLEAWQNRNDRVDWCMVYDRVLNNAEIKFYST